MTDLRGDLAKARDAYFESKEGITAMSGTRNGVVVIEPQFLRNRLERAFLAGAKTTQPDETEKAKERAFNEGFMEGESKQAILEIRARDKFLDENVRPIDEAFRDLCKAAYPVLVALREMLQAEEYEYLRCRAFALQEAMPEEMRKELGELKGGVPKDCPKQLGEVVKHNGTTANAAYQLGQTMHHDVDVLIEKLSESRKGLETTVKELTKTLNEMTKK